MPTITLQSDMGVICVAVWQHLPTCRLPAGLHYTAYYGPFFPLTFFIRTPAAIPRLPPT